jgi:hypothetical protein
MSPQQNKNAAGMAKPELTPKERVENISERDM